ncbi:MAG: pyridoxamine 5'-phosphate oxidase family protein [Pseudomonadota bacterium]
MTGKAAVLTGRDRKLLHAAERGVLATVTPVSRPHVVPVVFTLVEDAIWMPVDGKPKDHTKRIARLRNIDANPMVTFLIDRYSSDWECLWWLRIDATAEIFADDLNSLRHVTDALIQRYPQYRDATRRRFTHLVKLAPTRSLYWSSGV